MVDVQQNSVNVIVTQICQRHHNSVGNGGKMASFFKSHAQNISDNGVILNNQNMHIKTFLFYCWLLLLLQVTISPPKRNKTPKTNDWCGGSIGI